MYFKKPNITTVCYVVGNIDVYEKESKDDETTVYVYLHEYRKDGKTLKKRYECSIHAKENTKEFFIFKNFKFGDEIELSFYSGETVMVKNLTTKVVYQHPSYSYLFEEKPKTSIRIKDSMLIEPYLKTFGYVLIIAENCANAENKLFDIKGFNINSINDIFKIKDYLIEKLDKEYDGHGLVPIQRGLDNTLFTKFWARKLPLFECVEELPKSFLFHRTVFLLYFEFIYIRIYLTKLI